MSKKMRYETDKLCTLCLVETQRSSDSNLCNTCYLGIERFFLLYFTRPDLRSRLPVEIKGMLIDVVVAIVKQYDSPFALYDPKIKELIEIVKESSARKAKVGRYKSASTGGE